MIMIKSEQQYFAAMLEKIIHDVKTVAEVIYAAGSSALTRIDPLLLKKLTHPIWNFIFYSNN